MDLVGAGFFVISGFEGAKFILQATAENHRLFNTKVPVLGKAAPFAEMQEQQLCIGMGGRQAQETETWTQGALPTQGCQLGQQGPD